MSVNCFPLYRFSLVPAKVAWVFLLTVILYTPLAGLGQTDTLRAGTPGCGADTWLAEARKNPHFVLQEKAMNEKIRATVLSRSSRPQLQPTKEQKADTRQLLGADSFSTPYVIPIVFHIISNAPESISDGDVFQALDQLNDAFAHRNAFNVDSNGADTYIQFCLARTAPDGGLTNGIDRVNSFYGDHDAELEGGIPSSLITWDPSRYVNVWVVNSIQAELQPSTFKCGSWKRMGIGGYAAAGWGAVVAGLSTPLVAHELGHYLSLLHTFTGRDCANTDCQTQGDLVCDTPPDKSIDGSPCSNPENSCSTDTLSGPFTKDVADNISNFMDYGSPCRSVFTPGQGARMRAFLENFLGGALINSTVCTQPCGDSLLARFNWNSNPHPRPGDTVTFSNTSVAGTTYKWYVNDSLVDSTLDLRFGFPDAGRYKVVLHAFGADSTCLSSYTGIVYVNCGVFARFSPTERIVASKKDVYSYPTRFWNKSWGWGTLSYSWYITDIYGKDSLVSHDVDLIYDFPEPGKYKICLEATNGTCVDRSPVFTLPVEDPTADALINFKQIDCYKEDSIRIVFSIANTGFDTIPAPVSVRFYYPSHTLPGAQLLNPVFYTDRIVIGKCEEVFVHIVKAASWKQDTLSAIVNEDKIALEKSYTNNSTTAAGFQYKVGIEPALQKVYVNSDTFVKIRYRPNHPAYLLWTSNMALHCSTCDSVSIRVTDTTAIKLVSESIFGCHDSAFAAIHVYPLDLILQSKELFCYKNDSLLVTEQVCLGNRYRQLKREVNMNYYDRDPATPGAQWLGALRIPREAVFIDTCLVVTTLIKMTTTGYVYAYINDPLSIYEDSLRNNRVSVNYVPFHIRFQPPSMDVYRNEPQTLTFQHSGEPYVRLLWAPAGKLSCSDCPSPILTTTNNERIKVVGITRYNCTDSAYLEIHAFSRNHLVLPNVFTPNGDGRNDYFYVIASNQVARVRQFQIYNRWGEKVFEAANVPPNDITHGWKGTYKGAPALAGTYVYSIVVELVNGELESVQGNITIIR